MAIPLCVSPAIDWCTPHCAQVKMGLTPAIISILMDRLIGGKGEVFYPKGGYPTLTYY